MESIKVSDKNIVYDSRDNCNAIIETKTNTLVKACDTTKIPKSVTGIGKLAFDNVKYSYIPDNITTIKDYAFYNLPEEGKIYCQSEKVKELVDEKVGRDAKEKVVVDATKFE